MTYGLFEIDGKVYSANQPLNCGLSETTKVEYEEPVTAYAEPNVQDAWMCSEGWN